MIHDHLEVVSYLGFNNNLGLLRGLSKNPEASHSSNLVYSCKKLSLCSASSLMSIAMCLIVRWLYNTRIHPIGLLCARRHPLKLLYVKGFRVSLFCMQISSIGILVFKELSFESLENLPSGEIQIFLLL